MGGEGVLFLYISPSHSLHFRFLQRRVADGIEMVRFRREYSILSYVALEIWSVVLYDSTPKLTLHAYLTFPWTVPRLQGFHNFTSNKTVTTHVYEIKFNRKNFPKSIFALVLWFASQSITHSASNRIKSKGNGRKRKKSTTAVHQYSRHCNGHPSNQPSNRWKGGGGVKWDKGNSRNRLNPNHLRRTLLFRVVILHKRYQIISSQHCPR